MWLDREALMPSQFASFQAWKNLRDRVFATNLAPETAETVRVVFIVVTGPSGACIISSSPAHLWNVALERDLVSFYEKVWYGRQGCGLEILDASNYVTLSLNNKEATPAHHILSENKYFERMKLTDWLWQTII